MTEAILVQRIKALKLHGLAEHYDKISDQPWLLELLSWEEEYRTVKGLSNRLRAARIGKFKPLSEFDWSWPKQCDRDTISHWTQLDFLKETINPILCGPNGVGKTMIAQNIAHQSVLKGHTALFTTAAQMLNELAALDSDTALRRRIKHYVKPTLLVIDEVGYLSYSNRFADLFFEIISQRYENKSTLITTNKAFTEWHEIFPNAACVVSIIDRLVHHSEIVGIDADSYRLKEAKEKNSQRKVKRTSKTKTTPTTSKDK